MLIRTLPRAGVQRTSQVSFVDVYRRRRSWLRRSGPRRRERLRRDVHERRPRDDRRNRQRLIHTRPQRHARRIAGSRRSMRPAAQAITARAACELAAAALAVATLTPSLTRHRHAVRPACKSLVRPCPRRVTNRARKAPLYREGVIPSAGPCRRRIRLRGSVVDLQLLCRRVQTECQIATRRVAAAGCCRCARRQSMTVRSGSGRRGSRR